MSILPMPVPTPPVTREPMHVQLARRLVREVEPPDNRYGTPTVIQFAGQDGATASSNVSVCSTLVTHLLKRAYNFTNANFTTWTGETSPESEDYYDAAIANNGFARVTNIANLQIGDLFIAKYLEPVGTATGHVAMAAALPRLVSSTASERRYELDVIDSTSSYHGPDDTRHRIDPTTNDWDDGVGQGTMRMITDTSGLLIKYSWSTLTTSIVYGASERPSLFATVPPYNNRPPRVVAPPNHATLFADRAPVVTTDDATVLAELA